MESSRQTLVQQDEVQGDHHVQPDVYDVASMPGFRFQPTEEELVGFYLRSMVIGNPRLEVELINVLDLYRYDPWELPAMAFMQGEREWLFFCPRDKKYPNGARPNRVTASGYWKATGTDRQVRRAHDARCIGLKKTLVFYTGKAPKGRKTEWIMNEYRLPQNEQHLRNLKDPREVALCRIYKKPAPNPNTATLLCADLMMEESPLGPESSKFRDPGDGILHNVEQPCASTSSPTSPSSPKFGTFKRDAICATEGSKIHDLGALNPNSHDTYIKTETGTLSSVLYPCPVSESPDSIDALLAQMMDAERRPVFLNSPASQIRVATPATLPGDQLAGCNYVSPALDRLLKASMWSSPLAMHDDLLPVSSSSFFSMNYGATHSELPWLHHSSSLPARQSLLQIQGLGQDHFQ